MSSSTTSSASDHNRSNATAIAVPFLLERNCDGETPFHVALRCRNLAAAEELFADVKTHQQILIIKNNSGETPVEHILFRLLYIFSLLYLLGFPKLSIIYIVAIINEKASTLT